ncbi:hypothetical protein AWZ03_015381, partial [Drosophila navojoa]
EIIRDDYESVELFCANGFIYNDRYESQTTEEKRIKLTCKGDINKFTTDEGEVSSIKCYDVRVLPPIYLSETPMEGCNKYWTLVVGQSYGKYGSIKNLAFCYDFSHQQLKYVSYTAYPSKIKVLEQSQVGQLNKLGLDSGTSYVKNSIWPHG